MKIRVRLLASYRSYLPQDHGADGGFDYEVEPGTTVREVLQRLPMPATDRCTFFLNGRHGQRGQVLQEGDELTVFPAVGGG